MYKNTATILIFFFLGFCLTPVFGQENIGGIPVSFQYKSVSNDIPFIKMPFVDDKKLKAEDEINDKDKSKPWRFGENIEVGIDIITSGIPDTIPGKGIIRRVGIHSAGAVSLNITFNKFRLPLGAVLYIYNKEKTQILGGFDWKNNREDYKFACAPIAGNSIIIEYFQPFEVDFEGEINIYKVTHGYRGLNNFEKGFGSSGDCNMNVACFEDQSWSEQIRSVCMILTGNNSYCTGTLINNTNEDGKPYILTAEHCYKDPTEWVFRFNWQSPTCSNPNSSPNFDLSAGAKLVAKNEDSDFCLIEMDNIPPAEYKVYYAGWDATAKQPEKQICIHHPNGDIKKISIDDNPAVLGDFLPQAYLENSHWQVISWDLNTTTESGSSGSPLFNNERNIIGQLHGGEAACGNTKSDFFGALSMSWDRGSDPSTRLKDWLDPNDTGVKTLSGFDPNFTPFNIDLKLISVISPKGVYYIKKNIIPQIVVMNRGLNTINSFTVTYSIDNGSSKNIEWTGALLSGETVSVELAEFTLTEGSFEFKVNVSKPNNTDDQNIDDNSIISSYKVKNSLFYDDFEQVVNWELSGEFEIGEPKGLGGSSGTTDPNTAFSGKNILGQDISGIGEFPGDYESNLGIDSDYAISPEFDCSSYSGVGLVFKRWLGIEEEFFDATTIDVKAGGDWVNVWRNDGSVSDRAWTEQIIDISQTADNKSKVRIRFSVEKTDEAQNFCGWNIDDIAIISGVGVEEISKPESFCRVLQTGNFIIIENPNSENLKTKLFDISGRLHFISGESSDNSFEISTKNLSDGIYILSVENGKQRLNKKILIGNK